MLVVRNTDGLFEREKPEIVVGVSALDGGHEKEGEGINISGTAVAILSITILASRRNR